MPTLCFRPCALVPFVFATTLMGCSDVTSLWEDPDLPEIPQGIKNLSKTDIDFVVDAHLAQTKRSLQDMMRTLYLLNPDQLAVSIGAGADERVGRILPDVPYEDLLFAELDSAREVDAMLLAFDPLFAGDRIFALMVGITSQMRIAYNHEDEFFVLDQLDPQNITNFETNLGIIRSRLLRAETADGHTLLMLREGEIDALRHLDQLAGQIRVLNSVLSSREDRTKRNAVHAASTVTLLPVAGLTP